MENNKYKKLKIVHVLAYYGTYRGGLQLYTQQLAEEQSKQGHTVKIITSEGYGKQKKINGVELDKTKKLFSVFRIPFTPLLPFKLLKEDCDVLHAHLPLPWLDLCIVFKKLVHPKTKLIVTIHNYLPTKSILSKILAFIHNKILIKTVLSKADVIITTTKEFADSLPYKISKNKHAIIPLGVDIKKFYPNKKYDKNKVLFVGRLIPEKGLHILMETMQKVTKYNKNIKLEVIYSDIYNYKNYEKQISKLDTGFLRIRKNVPHSSMRQYYADAAVLVLPSIDLDSFGYVLIEALASGCPVITTNLPGPKKVIKNSKCGIVVPKGDKKRLREAISDILNNSTIRSYARNYAINNYNFDQQYKKTMDIYLMKDNLKSYEG